MWGQPFMVALMGQIPFTLLHLAGSVTFAVFLSLALYRWAASNEKLRVSWVLRLARVWCLWVLLTKKRRHVLPALRFNKRDAFVI